MSHATVSVVIPCYNQGRFLGEAISSVLSQTVPPDELIVVDDGSADDTAAVAGRFPAVTYVWQPNLGLAEARNRGLRESHGEHLVFLDSDDRLHPRAIETGLAELAAAPDAAFTFGRCLRIDQDGVALPTVPPPVVGGDAYAVMLTRNVIWTPAVVMFRRARCGRALWFNPGVDAAADYDLYLRLTRSLPARGHVHVVADYRLHDEGMSRDAALMLRSTLKVLRAHSRRATPADAAQYRRAVRHWRRYYGEKLVEQLGERARAGAWAAVARDVAVLLRHYPDGVARHLGRKVHRLARRQPAPRRQEAPPAGRPADRDTERPGVTGCALVGREAGSGAATND
jgi:glycosyltransferase involved in cell wall biosynthesis